MNAPANNLRLLDDDALGALIARLQRQVETLTAARGEVGHRIRLGYVEALTAAQAEAERRRT